MCMCVLCSAGLDAGLHAHRSLHGAGLRAHGAGAAAAGHEDIVKDERAVMSER
jgi:hypothetical protein